MKFILFILSISAQPQYAVGPFDTLQACQSYVRPAETKGICQILTSPRK